MRHRRRLLHPQANIALALLAFLAASAVYAADRELAEEASIAEGCKHTVGGAALCADYEKFHERMWRMEALWFAIIAVLAEEGGTIEDCAKFWGPEEAAA